MTWRSTADWPCLVVWSPGRWCCPHPIARADTPASSWSPGSGRQMGCTRSILVKARSRAWYIYPSHSTPPASPEPWGQSHECLDHSEHSRRQGAPVPPWWVSSPNQFRLLQWRIYYIIYCGYPVPLVTWIFDPFALIIDELSQWQSVRSHNRPALAIAQVTRLRLNKVLSNDVLKQLTMSWQTILSELPDWDVQWRSGKQWPPTSWRWDCQHKFARVRLNKKVLAILTMILSESCVNGNSFLYKCNTHGRQEGLLKLAAVCNSHLSFESLFRNRNRFSKFESHKLIKIDFHEESILWLLYCNVNIEEI